MSIYHHLPHPFKNIVAGIRGYQLRWWRYGSEMDRLIDEAIERESWSLEHWRTWQEERLAFMLHRARTTVPYYRKYWDSQQLSGNHRSWEYLENWPILTKEKLRNHPRDFLADGANPRKMFSEHTSGTSGTPLTLWLNRETVQAWYALVEVRWRNWYGVSMNDRWGIFGGQLVIPHEQNKPPFWVWNQGLNQLYLSSYHLSFENTKAYLEVIRSHRLVYLLGYASSLYSLAQMALEKNLDTPSVKLIISNAEPLYKHQREVIAKAFQCDVYDTYGQSENLCTASECSFGNLHLWPEVGITEIFDDEEDKLIKNGIGGRIISTGLLNPDMPLIRYEIGDRGSLAPETSSNCECGRTLPILANIEGRNDDLILTPDGRRIGRLDSVFKSDLPIREAQIIQESLSEIRVLYVPTSKFTRQNETSLRKRIQRRVGELDITLEAVENIPRTASGKFQAVISHLSN